MPCRLVVTRMSVTWLICVTSSKRLLRKGLHLDVTCAIHSSISVIGQQVSLHAGNSTPAQMHPCAVFRQQHAKSIMTVKLTSTDIMSAGNDGRICRYHWRGQSHSNAAQPQSSQR